jgi:two-component system chemotaxis response regulator CheY
MQDRRLRFRIRRQSLQLKDEKMFPIDTRILIIDDMPTMRKLVTRALNDLGFMFIKEAPDGTKGWEILDSSNPLIQLVISDWKMPDLTGIALLRKVRADKRFIKLPFILLTVESEPQNVLEATQSGVTDYIIKPFDDRMLKQKLTQVYNKTKKIVV